MVNIRHVNKSINQSIFIHAVLDPNHDKDYYNKEVIILNFKLL